MMQRIAVLVVAVLVIIVIAVVVAMGMIMRMLDRLPELMDLRAGGMLVGMGMMSTARRSNPIGTGLRFEWRVDRFDRGAQSGQQFLQNMIGHEAQESVPHLHGHVSIAKMIGGARECDRRSADHMENALNGGLDLDDAPVRGHHQIAATQDFSARQDEGNLVTGGECRAQPAFLPLLERQSQKATDLAAIGAFLDLELRADLNHRGQKRK